MKSLSIVATLVCCLSCGGKKDSFQPIVFTEENLPDNLRRIDDKLLSKWSGNLDTNYYEYYYFKDLGGPFKSRVIQVEGDDYFALRLLTFDKNEQVIADYELAGGDCGGPTELEDKIEFCPRRKSIMTSSSTFTVWKIQEYSSDMENWKPDQRDSSEWTIRIDGAGRIVSSNPEEHNE